MKSFLASPWRCQQFLHGADRSVMQIWGTRPDTAQSWCEVFARAPNSDFLRRLISLGLELGEKFVEAIRELLREHFGAARIRADLGYRVQPLIRFRAAVA